MTIGQIIKLNRMQLKMTQKTLASKLGVTEDFVSKMESGKSKVPIDKLKAMVKKVLLTRFLTHVPCETLLKPKIVLGAGSEITLNSRIDSRISFI